MEANGSGSVVDGIVVRSEHTPHELAVSEYHRKATDVAGLVRAIVTGKSVKIGPRSYVPVDAYQAIANAMGCVATARDVKRVESGYTAIGEVKRLSDGVVLAQGEGFVGDDEPKWKNGPEYARRSMVQTRAIGRACRAAFAFVVPMIDLNLSSTPAEEMDGINTGSTEPPPPQGAAGLKAKLAGGPPPPPPPPPSPPVPLAAAQHAEQATHDRAISFRFGKNKGVALKDLDESSLGWYEKCLSNDIGDPAKANFATQNQLALNAVRAEMAFRNI